MDLSQWRDRGLFLAWLVVGVLAGTGVLGLLTIGGFLLAGAALGTIVLLSVFGPHRGALGLVAGLGGSALWIAWLNRGGPGEVCHALATGEECVDAWSPWPWLLVALILVGSAAAGFHRLGLNRRLDAVDALDRSRR